MRWSESPSERILRIRRDSTIESWSEELELESGGLGVSSQGSGVSSQESVVRSWRVELAARAKVRGRRADWRTRACLRAQRDFDRQRKGRA